MARTNEWEASLRRAFVDNRADYIVLTSRREEFLLKSANYGINRGWLTGTFEGPDVQSMALVCRLTKEGRKHFGLEDNKR